MLYVEQSDSEYMAGQLSAYGYGLTEIPNLADLWLINTWAIAPPLSSIHVCVHVHFTLFEIIYPCQINWTSFSVYAVQVHCKEP